MKSFALLVTVALGGCAVAPAMIPTNPPAVRILPVAKLEVDDFATAKQVRESDAIYFTGWFPIADKWVKPNFHEAIAAKIKGSFKAGERGEVMQLAIIESGLFMDVKVADSVVFVSLASTFRDRPYKCNLVVNIKTSKGSERREFEHVQVANRAFSDLEDKPGFVSKCQDALVQKLADYLTKAV